ILNTLADYGVLLLLFSIGLKLKIKNLLKREIWATATAHMLISTVIFSFGIYLLSLISFSLFTDLDYETSLLIAFALSFSSTVFAVKIFEEKGSMGSVFGVTAIGILILQDLFAVVFLSLSKGEYPSIWALALLALLFIPALLKYRPFSFILDKSGHGELLVLLGIIIPIGAAHLFDMVNLKPDLGALLLGVLLSGHSKSKELSNAMLSFKDLFLVGFFLTIGLGGTPTLEAIGIAVLLALVLPIKTILFFLLMTKFKLRARTATLSSLSLTNYSEFGLIVGSVGVSMGWMNSEWLVILAIALSITFVMASPLNTYAVQLYSRMHNGLQKFESKERLSYEMPIDSGSSHVVILGMGKLGASAYDALSKKYGSTILGIDYDEENVLKHKSANRNVVHGDATDSDFWERVCPANSINIVVLTMEDHSSNLLVLEELRTFGFKGKVTVTAEHEDEIEQLINAGADKAFNFYAEAGVGFADHICQIYEGQKV
ncbi:MAG: cation:proton antiporter family protein, partial [Bacteroidota bacterium]